MTPEAIAFSDAIALGRLIAKKQISSVELTQLYLSRLEKYGASYGAVVTIMHDRALREARAADKALAAGNARGPLHGVPFGASDNSTCDGSYWSVGVRNAYVEFTALNCPCTPAPAFTIV